MGVSHLFQAFISFSVLLFLTFQQLTPINSCEKHRIYALDSSKSMSFYGSMDVVQQFFKEEVSKGNNRNAYISTFQFKDDLSTLKIHQNTLWNPSSIFPSVSTIVPSKKTQFRIGFLAMRGFIENKPDRDVEIYIISDGYAPLGSRIEIEYYMYLRNLKKGCKQQFFCIQIKRPKFSQLKFESGCRMLGIPVKYLQSTPSSQSPPSQL